MNFGGDWKGTISTVVTDPQNPDRIYLATASGAIWRTGDAGLTWSEISGDFPGPPLAIHALAVRSNDAQTEPTLFAASSVGVYASTDSGGTVNWVKMSNGLPDVNVTDLRFNRFTKYLVAGTYGRGVFAAYTHFLTNMGPGASSLNNTAFCFATDLDGSISVNQAQEGSLFSGWFAVQGGGRTDAALAAAAVKDTLFIVGKGLDQRIYLNQAKFGHPFTGWVEVQGGGRADAALAAAAVKDTLFIVGKGLDQRIYLNQAKFGHPFTGWVEVEGGGRTDTTPAAVAVNQHLIVFMKGLDGRIYRNQAEFGHAFDGWVEVGGGIS